MGFEIFDSENEVAVQDNTKWERNRRMAVEAATVLVAMAGIIGIAIENADEKRKKSCLGKTVTAMPKTVCLI